MAGSDFDQMWVPRIGQQATAELRRNGYLTLFTWPAVFGLAIACSFAFGSGKAVGIALGLVAAVIAIAIFALWITSRIKLAAAISQWFGVKIQWTEMPKMRAQSFDSWCEKRKLVSPQAPA